MKLIIGLGNPGKKYEKTRHNFGFLAIDELQKQTPKDAILLKPDTFMNKSGKAVKEKAAYYKIKPQDIWVIHDDIDLPLGEYKISRGQGSAGHKGVQSIIDELGTKDFNRIRLGICPASGKPSNVEDFVLQKFTAEEEKIITGALDLLRSDFNKLN
ncbi:MAG: aminoacyl-tRNA hydrolase [Candidatus Nealsonbacteria bacterium]|nr:aminoacyl-tRNA hydrolase [Candidatus Nealsonbacteria bacterium]